MFSVKVLKWPKQIVTLINRPEKAFSSSYDNSIFEWFIKALKTWGKLTQVEENET